MISKWYNLKRAAVKLRKEGKSIRDIEIILNIPRSTLSGWFKNVLLTKKQKEILYHNWKKALVKARTRAVMWHNEQKRIRLREAKKQAESTFNRIEINNNILDLALAALYLGEGFKKTCETGMGNSDPLILKFFVASLIKNYQLQISKIKCELHLRADQKPDEMKSYWSKELNVPLANFKTISMDQRTAGQPTYPDYKGVCVVRCGAVAIQRKLLYLIRMFCEKIIRERARSSVG